MRAGTENASLGELLDEACEDRFPEDSSKIVEELVAAGGGHADQAVRVVDVAVAGGGGGTRGDEEVIYEAKLFDLMVIGGSLALTFASHAD